MNYAQKQTICKRAAPHRQRKQTIDNPITRRANPSQHTHQYQNREKVRFCFCRRGYGLPIFEWRRNGINGLRQGWFNLLLRYSCSDDNNLKRNINNINKPIWIVLKLLCHIHLYNFSIFIKGGRTFPMYLLGLQFSASRLARINVFTANTSLVAFEYLLQSAPAEPRKKCCRILHLLLYH